MCPGRATRNILTVVASKLWPAPTGRARSTSNASHIHTRIYFIWHRTVLSSATVCLITCCVCLLSWVVSKHFWSLFTFSSVRIRPKINDSAWSFTSYLPSFTNSRLHWSLRRFISSLLSVAPLPAFPLRSCHEEV